MFGLGLQGIKNKFNMGAALRATGCFGGDFVIVGGGRARDFAKSLGNTNNAHNKIPIFEIDNCVDLIPYDCVPVAIELVDSGVNLINYKHPKNAYYIFGAEDATLGKKTLEKVRDVVYIPTNGCLNLAASINVVLYDRIMKGM